MTVMELFNSAILLAFIYFSAWAFYLKFKANKVTTTRDLLHAFITGGVLAVTTMVFGVTDEIIEASASIKQDTVSIRTTLEGEPPFENLDRNESSGNEQLAELFRINQEQSQAIRRLLGVMTSLQENSEQTNRLLRMVLETSGTGQEIPATLSGPQIYIELGLFCSIPVDDRTSNCVIRPNER